MVGNLKGSFLVVVLSCFFLVTLHTIRILDLSAFRSTEAHSDPVLGLPLPLINQK